MKKHLVIHGMYLATFLVGLGLIHIHTKHVRARFSHALAGMSSALSATRRTVYQLSRAVKSKETPTNIKASSWIGVQRCVEDAVVQVFTETAHIDWLEPYRPRVEGASGGSGFFINRDGDIVTNYHVVSHARFIKIRLPALGQERYDVSLVGACPDRDIALLRLTQETKDAIIKKLGKISYLQLGDSDAVGRTQEVMALGFPLGNLGLKSTIGNVSGWQRIGNQSFIELTSPINPGNSGGPTVNAAGKVVGINSAGIPSAQNIGYFIPIAEVKNALKDLYKIPFLRKPVLGANFSFYTDTVRKFLGNPPGGGWYVTRVFEGALLAKAGLKEGDVIYEINGHQLDAYGDVEVSWAPDSKVSVLDLLNRYTTGDHVELVYYRNGTRYTADIEMDGGFILPVRKLYEDFDEIEYEIFGGMIIMPLSLNVLQRILNNDGTLASSLAKYGRPENQYEQGLIVTHIFSGSPAKDTKLLSAGACLDKVNGQKVRTLEQFRDAIASGRNSDYITITTLYSQVFTALELKDVREREPKLAAHYGFKVSSSFQAIA